jgi:HAD superfamily hydrolase (TIGR01549 family)
MRSLIKAESKRDVAVLFDLEDTLVQTPWSSHQHVVEFRRSTREKLVGLGVPAVVLEGIERATIMRNKASEYVENHFGEPAADRFGREMEQFLSRYELDSAKKSMLFDETISTLETLKRLGVKMGLVTNTSRKAVDVVLQVHGLREYFDVVVTRESVRRLKPAPEGILLAVEKLDANRFLMVGDLILDVLAAKNAGGAAIIVIRNPEQSDFQGLLKSLRAEVLKEAKRTVEERGDLHADYIIQSLAEVPAIVQAEKGKTGSHL